MRNRKHGYLVKTFLQKSVLDNAYEKTLYFCCIVLIIHLSGFPALARQGRTCGVDALYQVCLHYNLNIPYGQVHEACHPTEDGNSMLDLFQAAQQLGFSALGMRLEWKDLVELDSSAIAFVSGNHFVAVLEADAEGDRVKVVDYPEPEQWQSREEFEEIWKGEILVVTWTPRIEAKEISLDGPRIRFEHTLKDFGVVSQGEKIEHEFVFWSEGKKPLVIEKVSSSCSCTATLLSATEVLPGSSGAVKITLDTSGRRGRQTQYVSLITNDPTAQPLQLTFSGIVKVEVAYSPKQIYFGKVRKGDSAQRRVILTDSGEGDLQILDLISDNPALALSWEPFEDERIEDDLKRYAVNVSLDPESLPLGRFEEKIVILTSVPKKPQIEIPVQGEIVGDIHAYPPELFFGVVKNNGKYEKSIELETHSRNEFRVLQVENSVRGLKLTYSFKELIPYCLVLYACFQPKSDPGQSRIVKDSIRIRTDIASEPIVEVPFYALVFD